MKISQELKIKYPKLYEAALDEFSSLPYENASLNNILKNAGMSKGSFYHNFKDKYSLYREIFACIGDKKLEFIKQSADYDNLPHNLVDRLKGMCLIALDFLVYEPKMHAFNEQFQKNSPELMKKIMSDFNYTEVEMWRKLIDDAYQNNDIRTDIPRNIVIPFLENTFKSVSKLMTPGMTVEDYKEIAFQYIELIRDAISNKK